MCSYYIYYYEDENIFMDECGEVVYDLFTVITPSDLKLFQYDWSKFDQFPMVGQEGITVRIETIPANTICQIYQLPRIDMKTAYKYCEEFERKRMANVTG